MVSDMSSHDEQLLGSKQVCDTLRIDKATLSRWVATGRVTPAHQLPGRNGARLFHRADVEALAARTKGGLA